MQKTHEGDDFIVGALRQDALDPLFWKLLDVAKRCWKSLQVLKVASKVISVNFESAAVHLPRPEGTDESGAVHRHPLYRVQL